jgi:hypothetical protein
VNSAKIVDDSIVNADINSAAAIAYSKLNLAGSIVNADINASAAIAASKLSGVVVTAPAASQTINYGAANVQTILKMASSPAAAPFDIQDNGATSVFTVGTDGVIATPSVSNGSVASGAAIAYSKLNLSNSIVLGDLTANSVNSAKIVDDSIVNADINSAAAIAYSKLNLAGSIVNADVNASAAIAYSKLSLSNSIVNADINASAAIAYSKLNIANSVQSSDLTTAAKTHTVSVAFADPATDTTDIPERAVFVAPTAGTIVGVSFTTNNAVTGDNANNRAFTFTRRTAATPGTANAVAAFTTTTGNDLTAFQATRITAGGLSNTSLLQGDVVAFALTHGGNGATATGLLVTVEYTTSG